MTALLRCFVAGTVFAATLCGANATTFFWRYSSNDVDAHGTVDTIRVSNFQYRITGVSGERNGVAIISGAIDYANADDLMLKAKLRLDQYGFAFVDVNGNAFKVYYDFNIPGDPYACAAIGVGGYCELGPGIAGTDGVGDPREPVAFFSMWEDLPEPSTWSMLMGGGLLFAVGLRWKRRPRW